MEEINLDLNNIFKLSYNFEGLKVLLTSIAKNQDMMIERIKKLESKPQIESMSEVNFPDDQKQIQIEENQINEKQIKEESNNSSKEEKDICNNFIISDLKNRILNIENEFSNLRKFIPQYKESRTLNDILDEHKSNLNDLNENVRGINDSMSNIKENMENIKLKVMDFSVFDAFKDKNVTADIDAAELLIKSLENKINEKFKFNEDKMKIDEQDIMKLKTELTNIKNSSNFQTKNLTYIKEEIDSIQKSIEQLKTNTSDNIMQNRELIRKLKEKNNSNSKDFSISINSMKQKITSLEEKMQKMFEDIQNNIKKEENIDLSKIEQEFIKNDEFTLFKDNIQKKCSHLEKKFQSLSENIKTEELEEKIYQINKELKNKKPDEKEFFSLSEQVQSHQDFFDSMKIDPRRHKKIKGNN